MNVLKLPGVRPLTLRALTRIARDLDPGVPTSDPAEAVERALATVRADGRPVVAGPWTSEVGFEVLYWIPFLRWLRDNLGLDPQRVVSLSRGGAESWYRDVAGRYLDIFELVSPGEFRSMTARQWDETGGQKQMVVGSWETGLLAQARARLGLGDSHVLHPSLMYAFFRSFWQGRTLISEAARHLVFERFAPPAHPSAERLLPEGSFVAVKFYFRPSFPDSPSNRALARRLVGALAQESDVVLLNTGMTVDDHADLDPGPDRRVVRLEGCVNARDNLAAQSTAIARARAFVGTYGGLTYLATAHGTPALCLASSPDEIVAPHVEVGRLASRALAAPVALLGPSELEIARIAGGAVQHRHPVQEGGT